MRPPAGLSYDQIDELVASNRFWIYLNLAEWRDLNTTAVVREWVNGEAFLYLGRSYRLSLETDQECDLKLKEGRFCLNRNLIDEFGVSAAKRPLRSITQTRLRDTSRSGLPTSPQKSV